LTAPSSPTDDDSSRPNGGIVVLTRRGFVASALCAASGFLATAVAGQTAGIKRTVLGQTDGPVEGYVTITVRAEIEPGALVARHTHPGIESTYVVEGATELDIEGQPARQVAAGEAFQVPAGAAHSAKNGPTRAVLSSTYVVEKGKPLASPA
jgi:quercetin dioxygenase-like cupin family protein